MTLTPTGRHTLMPAGYGELAQSTPQSVFYDQGRFGRPFPTLPAFAADTPLLRAALLGLGAKTRPMDPGDDMSDPITLITDPAKSADHPTIRRARRASPCWAS